MTEKVLEKAKELALAIAESPEFIAMRVAEQTVENDEVATQLFARYAEKKAELEAITCEDDPNFEKMGALTNELNAIKEELQALPSAEGAQVARMYFSKMMQAVNEELQKALNPEGSCSGNCASCGSSCGHNHHHH